MGQGLHVLDNVMLGAQDRADPVAGVVDPPQARHPLAGVSRIAPAGPLLFQHTSGGFGEGGYALGAALLRQRVPALAGELAVGQRLLPGLGQ